MASFSDVRARDVFLSSAERAAFIAFADPFVDEWYVFEFESGLVQ